MRLFSYRNKRRAKQILIALAVILGVVLLFCVCRFIYLQRFLVYTGNSVKLDYSQSLEKSPEAEGPAWDPATVEIVTKDPVVPASAAADEPMKPLSGYYITTEMLLDMDAVNSAMAAQETPQTVMLDLKSIYGNFYYSSGTPGAVTSSADTKAIDALIDRLAQQDGPYLIARIASLSDTNFALAHQSCGLPLRSGALWMDEHGCYWLDPMEETVQEYLASIAQELASMGFDEVVFDDFRIPESGNTIYQSELSREDAAAEAAKAIRTLLEDTPIRVSFNSSNAGVAESSGRIYLVTEDGSAVAGLVESLQDSLEDPAAQIVFLTPSRDTRFEGYGLLRPLIEARVE